MWARSLLTFSLAVGVQAQQNPADLLRLVQAKVADTLSRIPRYMCTQTIDRVTYEPDVYSGNSACDTGPARPPTHLVTSDRLRLDVAMTSTIEMYSWVGESRFDDRDLMDMVLEGAISTGNFAAFLTAVFRTDEASFTYNGDSTEDGRALAEFGFRVPYEKSHYRFGQRPHLVVTGYDGTLLVDAKTGDLVRLIVRTSRLPSETAACYSTTTMDYARVRLSDTDIILLPTESRLHILDTNGSESENRTVFSACHEFLGESTITFDPPADGAASAAHHGLASRGFIIPRGLRFRVALTQGIDTATAAAGDPIKAKLITPIRDGSKVLVPMGASVAGRIVRMRQFYGSYSSVAIDIKLETVNVGGASIRLIATPDIGQSFPKTKRAALQQRIEVRTLRSLEDRSSAFVFRNVQQPYLISSGLESMWVTANPAAGDSVSTPQK